MPNSVTSRGFRLVLVQVSISLSLFHSFTLSSLFYLSSLSPCFFIVFIILCTLTQTYGNLRKHGRMAEFVYDIRTLLFRDASLNYTYLRHTLRKSWAKHSVAMFLMFQQSFLTIMQQRYWSAVMEPDEVS